MLSGVQPFKGDNIKELQKNILSGKFNKLDFTSYEVNNLIEGMLQVNPKKRFCIEDILNHPWLDKVDLNQRQKLNLFTGITPAPALATPAATVPTPHSDTSLTEMRAFLLAFFKS